MSGAVLHVVHDRRGIDAMIARDVPEREQHRTQHDHHRAHPRIVALMTYG